MKAGTRVFMGLLMAVECLTGCGDVQPEDLEEWDASDSVVADELIVTVLPGAKSADLQSLFEAQGATIRGAFPELNACLLGIDPEQRSQVRSALEASALVEEVMDNEVLVASGVPSDPGFVEQWYLHTVQAPEAWEITTGSEEVLVAVLDTGIDADHEDLAGKVTAGGNTYGDASSMDDLLGHGTAVAGVISAATNNDRGVASLAWKNPVLSIRVSSDMGRATSWSIAAGIALAVDQGAKVINISFAPLQTNTMVLRQAHQARLAGAVVIIAAGNTGEYCETVGSDDVLFVGAIDQQDEKAWFSTYGSFVDLVAPGVSIYVPRCGNSYGYTMGTSFAAPIVSGVAALIWSVRPELSVSTVEQILLTTARDLGPQGWDEDFAAGCVDAARAVESAQTIVETADETFPDVSIQSPLEGARLSNDTTVRVEATDDGNVTSVTMYIDEVQVAVDSSPPYAFALSLSDYSFGSHSIRALATDALGHSSWDQVAVTFASSQDRIAPTVWITSPLPETTLRGVVTIQARLMDETGLASAEVLVDGLVVSSVTLTDYEAAVVHNWDTSQADVEPGLHTICVRAADASDNTGSSTIDVYVQKY